MIESENADENGIGYKNRMVGTEYKKMNVKTVVFVIVARFHLVKKFKLANI